VVYGYDTVGMLSVIPLSVMVGSYLVAVFLILLSVTLWSSYLRTAILNKKDELDKEGKTWIFYNLGDWVCLVGAAQIFQFNGFETFAFRMYCLLGVSLVYFVGILRMRYVIWQTLRKN
jgi:hypothetical protein